MSGVVDLIDLIDLIDKLSSSLSPLSLIPLLLYFTVDYSLSLILCMSFTFRLQVSARPYTSCYPRARARVENMVKKHIDQGLIIIANARARAKIENWVKKHLELGLILLASARN
jgi:uncharacterized membrane protein